MIDMAASHRHYLEHMLPVWRELDSEDRGTVHLTRDLQRYIPGSVPLESFQGDGPPVLVAGFDDIKKVGKRKIILMEHGCGQSYGGDPISARHPAYAGGDGRHGIAGFLCPNEYAAERNRVAVPDAFVEVIGSPRLAALQGVPPAPPYGDGKPVVAFGFHWDATVCHESMSAWRHWVGAVAKLAQSGDFEVIGHAHPRMFRDVAPTYRDMGVEPVGDFMEVLQRAHVYCADNTSTMFEWAALRGPTVVLDCPWYRLYVDHGLRFWDAADIGPRIGEPAGLGVAVKSALAKRPWPGADERLARVFPAVENPARAAAVAAAHAATLADKVKSRGDARFPRVAPL